MMLADARGKYRLNILCRMSRFEESNIIILYVV